MGSERLELWGSKLQTGPKTEDPYLILLGVECRVDEELDIRRDGQILESLAAGVQRQRLVGYQL